MTENIKFSGIQTEERQNMKHNYNLLQSQYGKYIYKRKHLPVSIRRAFFSFPPAFCLVALQKGMHFSSTELNEQIRQ